jgi:hypothetical protein
MGIGCHTVAPMSYKAPGFRPYSQRLLGMVVCGTSEPSCQPREGPKRPQGETQGNYLRQSSSHSQDRSQSTGPGKGTSVDRPTHLCLLPMLALGYTFLGRLVHHSGHQPSSLSRNCHGVCRLALLLDWFGTCRLSCQKEGAWHALDSLVADSCHARCGDIY